MWERVALVLSVVPTLEDSLSNVTHLCIAGVHGGFPSDKPFSVVSEVDNWECGQEFALCSPWL